MRILSTTFNVLTICGCWPPSFYRTSVLQKIFYDCYTALVVFLVNAFTLTQFLDMMMNVKNPDEFVDNSYTLLAMIVACCKMISLLLNRKNIAKLEEAFTREPFRLLNLEEIKIHGKFHKFIRSNTLRYTILIETTAMAFNVTSYFVAFKKNVLTFRAWLPYDSSSPTIFFFTYIHQLIGWTYGSLLHVGTDALICGFLIETCCQFEILESRLRRTTNDRGDELPKCVRHHDQIYEFAAKVNETFGTMILVQFLESTMTVCFNLYQLVKIQSFNSEVIQLALYMSCMLAQIFLYCWCGNEVKLKSLRLSSTIFSLNWTNLKNDAKKILIMIMNRAKIPIEITSATIVSMNLDSFVSLLKMSYSTYNLLQQSHRHELH